MKIYFPLQTRRKFLNNLLWGWLAAFLGGIIYPAGRFLFPKLEVEPDEVRLPAENYEGMPPDSSRIFAWGSKMGILIMTGEGKMRAFKGVCTHLTCNVTYLPEQKKFHCPCHEGWFDENGTNISGPPPGPLEEFLLRIEGTELVVSKAGSKGKS